MTALLAILDPDVILHGDAGSVPAGRPLTLRGAAAVARGARAGGTARARDARIMLIDGVPGIAYAPHGQLALVIAFTIPADTITQIDVITDPGRLSELDLAMLN